MAESSTNTPNIASAIAKAREIAAKLASQAGVSSHGSSNVTTAAPIPIPESSSLVDPHIHPARAAMKRALEESDTTPSHISSASTDLHSTKRPNYNTNDSHSSIPPSTFTHPDRRPMPPQDQQSEYPVTVEMFVPSNRVGLVIGRGGDTLKRISNENNIKIQVDQDREALERKITIQGHTNDDVERGRKSILEAIAPRQTTSNVPEAEAPGQITVNHKVPNSKVGLLIGPRGNTIRDLQQSVGCRLYVAPDDTVRQDEVDRMITIVGDEEGVERARRAIDEMMSKAQETPSSDKVIMHIPNDKVGLVIGRGGEFVKWLNTYSGAKVFIESQPTADMQRPVHLTGPAANVAYAQQVINDKLNSIAQRDMNRSTRGGFSGGGRGGYRGDQQQQQQQYQQPPQHQQQSSTGAYQDPYQNYYSYHGYAGKPESDASKDATKQSATPLDPSDPNYYYQYYQYYQQWQQQAQQAQQTQAQPDQK